MTKKGKNKEEEKNEDKEEPILIKKSISIATLNATVDITSEDPEDTINKLQELAVKTISKYEG